MYNAKKNVITLFKEVAFKMEIKPILKTLDVLDVTLNLTNNIY